MNLFETMLAVDGHVVQLEEHLARMARSAGTLDEDAFRAATLGAVRDGEHAIRVVLAEGTLAATAFDLPEITRSRRIHGRAVTLPASATRPLPQSKRYPEDLHLRDAIPPGADEALFVTPDGNILEGTSTNVFALHGDVLITAPDGVLPGTVRAWVLATAPTLGLRIEERAPTADDVRRGAFFTGSLTTLAPVRLLDGRPCALPGPAFEELGEMFRRRLTLHPS